LFVASTAQQGPFFPALTHIMASSSASVPVLAPVAERLAAAAQSVAAVAEQLATANADNARMEREISDVEKEKQRLGSRARAADVADVDYATAMADCQARLATARRRLEHGQALAILYARSRILILQEKTAYAEEQAAHVRKAAAYAEEQAKTEGRREEVPPLPAALQSAPVSHALYRALRSKNKITIPSPSKSDKSLLVAPFAHFVTETPLTVKTNLSPTHYASFGERPDAYSAGLKAAFIREALQYLPVGTRVVGKAGTSTKMSAKRLFPAGSGCSFPFVCLPWSFFPELAVRSDRGYPGFGGELKSLPPVAWNEALAYVSMSMLDSLFPGSELYEVYHLRPPTGYALMAMAGCGFFSAVEWVARLFIGPVSSSFTLGSEQHKAAVDMLHMVKVKRWVELNLTQSVKLSTYPKDADENAAEIMWLTSPAELRVKSDDDDSELLTNRFVKIITYRAFSHLSEHDAGYQFRHLHRVYTMYAELFVGSSGEPGNVRPPALVSARLLYGAFSVLVDMPFIDGRQAREEELEQDGPVLQQLAAAIAWLARLGLLYCDLRAPNVIVADKHDTIDAYLVDYDDMVIVTPGTVQSTDALVEKIREHAARHGLGDSAVTIGGRPALRRLLDKELQVCEVGG